MGDSAEEAEQALLAEHPELTVLRSKHIDVSDLRAHSPGGTFPPDQWVVVIEYPDPANPPISHQDDPEGQAEAQYRSDMIVALGKLGVDTTNLR